MKAALRIGLWLVGACACASTGAAQGSGPAPTLPQVVAVIERLNASNSLADVQQVLRANAPVVTHPATDALLTSVLQGQLTAEQRTIIGLAQETFRDARAGGLDLAAETLGVRVTVLELMAAPGVAEARAVLIKRRDVTNSALLADAFERLRAQPGANPQALQEIAAAFRESNQSVDAAVSRLQRLAGASPSTASTPSVPAVAGAGQGSGSASSGLAGHWRCTTTTGGGDVSITTDHHMVLNEDGSFRSWQHSFNSFSGRENTTAADTGRWVVRGNSFVFTGADGSTSTVPFQRSGDTILLPNESSRRIWERVR